MQAYLPIKKVKVEKDTVVGSTLTAVRVAHQIHSKLCHRTGRYKRVKIHSDLGLILLRKISLTLT